MQGHSSPRPQTGGARLDNGLGDEAGQPSHFDTIGVGFGPANIALAVAYAESGNPHTIRFLEANAAPRWQPGMLIDGSDIQHHPLRDFITPKNPCSPYGYLSYLKSEGRLFHFLNLDAPFPPRSDYEKYVAWVAGQFSAQVRYSQPVTSISLLDDRGAAGERLIRVETPSRALTARSLSFAPGRSPNIPQIFEPWLGDDVLHFTEYVHRRRRWEHSNPSSVAVIGSSQSAVEILLDMHSKVPGTTLHSVFRKFSYVLKDTSPFTEDLVFPEFTDYFYHSSGESRQSLAEQVVRSNYGSVDHDILKKLYFTLYENRVNGDASIVVHNNKHVVEVQREDDRIRLTLRDEHAGTTEVLTVDAVILATGFRNFGRGENEELIHPLLRDIAGFYEKNEDGTLHVTRDYRLVAQDEDDGYPAVFLNGLCESSHGLGDAGSFSLLSYRAFEIERSLARRLEQAGVPV